MTLTTPKELTSDVLSFCRHVNSLCKTLWVDVRPTVSAAPNQCYYNVSDHIKEHGGKIVFGWIIWESPGLFIEAEHHAILKTDNDRYTDLTPKADGETKILFLHDPSKQYSFKKPNWRVSIRRSTSSDPNVQACLDAKTTLDKFIIKNSRPNGRDRKTTIKPEQRGHYDRLESAVVAARYKMNAST